MFTILIFLIILGLLVFVHELGHFLTAKKLGIYSDEFGFGFPPRIVGFQRVKKGQLQKVVAESRKSEETHNVTSVDGEPVREHSVVEVSAEIDRVVTKPGWRIIWGGRDLTDEDRQFNTVYSLNWFPLGGFVKIKGESNEGNLDKDSFASHPAWQRVLVLAAGVTMNVVLAFVLLTGAMMSGLPQQVENGKGLPFTDHRIMIRSVSAGSVAEKGGLRPADFIDSIDGNVFTNTEDLKNYVSDKAGKELTYVITRGKTPEAKKLTPGVLAETGKGGVGIGIVDVGIVKYPWYRAIAEGFKATFVLLWMNFTSFGDLFRGILPLSELKGPVGIAGMTGQMADMGFIYLVQFAAMLSLGLAAINIMPIPVLDGGHILYILIEKIFRIKIPEKVKGIVNSVFMFLLLALIIMVTFRDISNLGCLTCKLNALFK